MMNIESFAHTRNSMIDYTCDDKVGLIHLAMTLEN